MCLHQQHKEKEHFTGQKKYRLADFLNMYWDAYCKQPTKFIEPEQYKAVNAIRVCRTEVLGIDYYCCPECGEMSEVRHNCNNRFCPTCSWLDTIKWSEKIQSQMLDIPHRHVVFTLPHQLIPLLERNKKQLLNILAKQSAETFKDWIKTKYGLNTGIISVIHTFGEKKNMHPHTHMIVAWGGIDFKTGDLKTIEDEFVKYKFLQNKFRCKYEDALIAAFDKGELEHNFRDRIEFMQFVKKINQNNWQIHLEPPMKTPAEVVRYIARYSKRACLSEYKISLIEGEYICFTYKDYRDRENPNNPKSKAKVKEMRLHYSEFFPLLLQHVAKPYFRLVRYYGCYGRFEKIPQDYKSKPEETKLSEQIEIEYQTAENNPKYCKSCTCAKIYIHTLIDKRIKQERNVPFDLIKHEHLIFRKIIITTTDKKQNNAA
jgi:hypothetical protein